MFKDCDLLTDPEVKRAIIPASVPSYYAGFSQTQKL